MTCKTIQIHRRFNGPPNSGNGGYTAGLLARNLPTSTAKVVLISPPPLDRDLSLTIDTEQVTLADGDQLIAQAEPAHLDLVVPACPLTAQIRAAAGRYATVDQHAQPVCFVCGPAREPGDGLRIFAAPIDGELECVAGFWQPHGSLDDGHGRVASEFVWAALDCPGYFAHRTDNELMLLGTMTASISERPEIGQPMIALGWQIEVSGRKYLSGTALLVESGDVVAKSEQIWIKLRE